MVAATAAIQPGLSEARVPYAGIATRAVALAADLLVIHVFILIVGALLGLVASLVGELRPEWLVATLVGAAWGLTVTIYFVLFWSITGQTPGMRAMRLRVVDRRRDPTVLLARVRPADRPPARDRAPLRRLPAGPVRLASGARSRTISPRTVVLYTDRTEPHGVVTGGP